MKHNLIAVEKEQNEKGGWNCNLYILLDKSVWEKIHTTDSRIIYDSQSVGVVHHSRTKDTHSEGSVTNVTGGKKLSSCPLESKTETYRVLKEKYPNGHKECIEYLLSLEEDGHKFINKGKQFKAIHNALRANYSFKSLDWAIQKIENKDFYKSNGWDMTSVVSYLEKARYGEK